MLRKMKLTTAICMTLMLMLFSMPQSAHAMESQLRQTASETTLKISFLMQEKSNWCWAASAAMISWFHGGTVTGQCQYVKWGLGRSDCPNNTGDLYNALGAIHKGAPSTQGKGSVVLQSLSMSGIRTEISQSQPMIAFWARSGAPGHTVVIHGYGSNSVIFFDPTKLLEQRLSYSQFVKHEGFTWAQTLKDVRR